MNAAVLIVNHTSGRALAGFVFNVLLIVRAPLQLFQAIQTSILPHLAGLEARESPDEFHKAIRLTIRAIAAFAGAVAIGLLAIGPFVMTALLGNKGFHYGRFGLAIVAIGMGLHLVSGTLNQAALARRRAGVASIAWLIAAAVFVAFVAAPTISSEVNRVEVGYFLATLLLCGMLSFVYRLRPGRSPSAAPASAPG
jgi:O-antigen/teichoic acid export membrane protein